MRFDVPTPAHCGVRVPCSRPLSDMPLVLANGCFRGAKRKSKIEPTMSDDGPSVWTGRALQAENDDLEKFSLALLYPASHDGISVKS